MKNRRKIINPSENVWLSESGSVLNLDITIDMNMIYGQLTANRDVKREVKHMFTK